MHGLQAAVRDPGQKKQLKMATASPPWVQVSGKDHRRAGLWVL